MPQVNKSILEESVLSALDRVCAKDKGLKTARAKVEGILREYADQRKILYRNLCILDVADDHGETHSKLLRFIDLTPRRTGQSERRYRRYKSEKESCVRRFVKAILGTPAKKDDTESLKFAESLILKETPDYIKSFIDLLPRAHHREGRGKDHMIRRLEKPLSEYSQLLVLAMHKVSLAFDIEQESAPVNVLLLDHYFDIRREVRALSSSPDQYELTCIYLCNLVRQLGLKREFGFKKISWDVEDWPQPLRDQYNEFLKLATGKITPDPALVASATKNEFSIITLSPHTIKSYVEAIAMALAIISHEGNLSILDLIRLQPTEVQTPEGIVIEDRNPIMEKLRNIEYAKSTRGKRINFDSALFDHFTAAVKAIAARIGYGHYIRDFNKVYLINLDEEGKQKRKDDKKQGIPRHWLDDQLKMIGEKFDYIVANRLFERSGGKSIKDADKAMRLCLFYPQALTLRYLGYRQQAIRNCAVLKNIRILPDGTVILSYAAKEVKNLNALLIEIKPNKHGLHERLRKILIAYHDRVLKYARECGDEKLEDQFFVRTDGRTGRFRRFSASDSNDYYRWFKERAKEFLAIHELERPMQDAIHPHFLRGVCADWLIIDLKMSYEDAAVVLGDTAQTVEKEYLDRHRIYNAGAVFNKYSERIIAIEENGELRLKMKCMEKERVEERQRHIVEIERKNQQYDLLKQASQQTEKRLLIELENSKAEILSLNEQIASLRLQGAAA